jgi:hypothetical protein
MIMQFEQDGEYLKITLSKTDGTYDVRYMTRMDATPLVQYIMNKSTANPISNLVVPTVEEWQRYQKLQESQSIQAQPLR